MSPLIFILDENCASLSVLQNVYHGTPPQGEDGKPKTVLYLGHSICFKSTQKILTITNLSGTWFLHSNVLEKFSLPISTKRNFGSAIAA